MSLVRVLASIGLLVPLFVGPVAWAQTTPEPPQAAPAVPIPTAEVAVFKVGNVSVLALRGVGANARVQQATATLRSILEPVAPPPGTVGAPAVAKPEVRVSGDDTKSQILVNGQVLLELTPEDNPQNTRVNLMSSTQTWATKIQQALSKPDKNSELAFQGLPEVLKYQGRDYVRLPEVSSDRATFTTDGSRSNNLVLFWIKKDGDPPPQVYVLNRYRQFIPYARTGS